jgi:hypothetical protein
MTRYFHFFSNDQSLPLARFRSKNSVPSVQAEIKPVAEPIKTDSSALLDMSWIDSSSATQYRFARIDAAKAWAPLSI